MKKSTLFNFFALIITISLLAVSCGKKEAKPAENKTLKDLMEAFNGESNASAKYKLYAAKADEEGYKDVALLFRAASKAEEIHAASHATVIKTLGGEAKAEIKTPAVKTTKENLEDAIKGETYERDVMYPGFLKDANAEEQKEAARSFTLAKVVENEHAKLYTEALANLENWKTGTATFFVCKVCGNTVKTMDFSNCPFCFEPKENFIKID